jgi:hypothetical protein
LIVHAWHLLNPPFHDIIGLLSILYDLLCLFVGHIPMFVFNGRIPCICCGSM